MTDQEALSSAAIKILNEHFECKSDFSSKEFGDEMFKAALAHRDAQIEGLVEAAREALDEFNEAQCGCSLPERLSGHLVGCWFPASYEKLTKLAVALSQFESRK